jgi:hypothetical protein
MGKVVSASQADPARYCIPLVNMPLSYGTAMTVTTVEERLTLGARLARLHLPEAAGKIEHRLLRDGNFREMCAPP